MSKKNPGPNSFRAVYRRTGVLRRYKWILQDRLTGAQVATGEAPNESAARAATRAARLAITEQWLAELRQ